MSAIRSRSIKPGFTHPFKSPILLFFLLFVSAPLLLFTNINAHAAQVTLTWDTSTGSNVAGYRLYYGTVHGSYVYHVDVGNTTSYALSSLSTGATYYFAVTGYDKAGSQSVYSNEVSYTVPSACTYSISSTGASINAIGGTGSISVKTQSGCAWAASSAASWVSITSGSSGAGSGTVKYSVSANTTTSSRTAASTIAGLSFTLTQAGVTAYTARGSTYPPTK